MKTSLKATLIATAIATLPLGSYAAGLGAINVYSGLGQPLRAEIELKATQQELQSISARLAPVDAFRQANVPYAPVLSNIRVAVETRGGRSVVRLSSDRPVNDPFVDLLLEVNWSSGRLVREYTFLLDPVDIGNAPAPQVATPAAAAPRAAAAAAPAARPAAAPMPESYRVARGDTLNRIADRHRPDGVSLDQMLVALFRANPKAFDEGNMNRLRAGAVLKMPDEAAAQAVEPAAARREVLAQSADFEAYRARLAGAAAAAPAAAEQPASQAGAGTIVPRVEEPARATDTGDRVQVSSAPADPSAGADEPGRLARLQSLEEELVARDKALEEANSRLAELEKNIRDLQEMLELRNRSLAQMQEQAGGAPQQAAQPAAPAPKPAAPAAPPPEPLPEPSLVDDMLGDPMLLAGGGAILALLLGYGGYRVHQRRKTAAAAHSLAPLSEVPAAPNSVFGGTGGQSVDTSSSSVIHTDFSQSGLSAIDADEGVDPVAEADVYMAYGRDAQAEEILLDALKADASRPAVFLKLLEIYAQRKSLKQFENIATDLYSRTGGEGADWAKAAEMGRGIDPENPLYGASSVGASNAPRTEQPITGAAVAAPAAAGVAAAAAVALADEAQPQTDEAPPAELSALDFTTSFPGKTGTEFKAELPEESDSSQLKETWAMPGDLSDVTAAADEAAPQASEPAAPETEVAAELPQIDASSLDFDLDLGDGTPEPVEEEGELTFDLDMDGEEPAALSAAPKAPAEVDPASATVIGDGRELGLGDENLAAVFDSAEPEPEIEAAPVAFDMDATVVRPPEEAEAGADDETVTDLEKTTFDSSLLDFDFDLEAAPPEGAAKAPAIDLSGIDLNLETPGTEEVASAAAVAEEEAPAPVEAAADNPEAAQEIDTKLELARAYEEMGDKEGARELIEEVLREGTAEQRGAAERLLERLA